MYLRILTSWSASRVVAHLLNGHIVVSEFELKSSYYFHFQINTQEKSTKKKTTYSSIYGLNSTTAIFLFEEQHSITHKVWYAIEKKNPNQT